MYWQKNPEDRPSSEDISVCIGKKEKISLNISLALSQTTALKSYDRRIATGATQNNNQLPENDGAAA